MLSGDRGSGRVVPRERQKKARSCPALGGIAGCEARETTDENPERVALIQRVTLACLRHALGIEEASWSAAHKTLTQATSPLGRLESR